MVILWALSQACTLLSKSYEHCNNIGVHHYAKATKWFTMSMLSTCRLSEKVMVTAAGDQRSQKVFWSVYLITRGNALTYVIIWGWGGGGLKPPPNFG